MKYPLIIKAAAAFSAGIYITFSQAHDAKVAMLGLVIVAAGWFIASTISAIRKQNPILSVFVIILSAAMVRFATSFDAINETATAWTLLEAWGVLIAISEIFFAQRAAKKSSARRDHLISAGLSIGLVVSQISITTASDSVSHVGFFGAYAILLAVHLAISSATPNGISSASPKEKA